MSALDAETPATPDDVGELVETLLAYALDEDGDVELSHENVLSAATALERVVRERDDARAWSERHHADLVSAEAKMAEARKVIARAGKVINPTEYPTLTEVIRAFEEDH